MNEKSSGSQVAGEHCCSSATWCRKACDLHYRWGQPRSFCPCRQLLPCFWQKTCEALQACSWLPRSCAQNSSRSLLVTIPSSTPSFQQFEGGCEEGHPEMALAAFRDAVG